MRLTLTIILYINFAQNIFAQKIDSTKQEKLVLPLDLEIPSTVILDSSFLQHTSSINSNFSSMAIPTCSCLQLRTGKFYCKQDTIPYQGKCVVLSGNSKPIEIDFIGYYHDLDFHILGALLNLSFTKKSSDNFGYIKIISKYSDGKRNGKREYYDEEFNLIKTEEYSEGALIKTIYP